MGIALIKVNNNNYNLWYHSFLIHITVSLYSVVVELYYFIRIWMLHVIKETGILEMM